MTSIFVSGLFYNTDADPEEEEKESDKTLQESIMNFGWSDFWIVVYSASITVPIPFVLRYFFRRKTIDVKQDTFMQMRKMKIKRIIGYIIVFCVTAWSSWSCIAFSLDFGYNTT